MGPDRSSARAATCNGLNLYAGWGQPEPLEETPTGMERCTNSTQKGLFCRCFWIDLLSFCSLFLQAGVIWGHVGPCEWHQCLPKHSWLSWSCSSSKGHFIFQSPLKYRTHVTMATYCIYVRLFAYFALPLITLGDLAFRCPSCTAERVAACPKVTPPCEIVRELGCGCCPVCAKREGELCGVYTPRCSSGLRCYPRAEAELPLQELLDGFGNCRQKVDMDIISLDDLSTNGKAQLFWFLNNDNNEVKHIISFHSNSWLIYT